MAVAMASCLLAAVPAPGGDEEEEANPKKPVKRVTVDDDPVSVGTFLLPDMVRAAATAKDPVLKKFYAGLTVAYDRIHAGTRSARVLPLPLVIGKDKLPPTFGASELTADNRAGEPREFTSRQIEGGYPFERTAFLEVERLLSPRTVDEPPPMLDKLTAAERALTAVLFFHESAVASNRRRGKNWEPFRVDLSNKLTEVRIAVANRLAADRKWDALREQTARFALRYKGEPKALRAMLVPRLLEAEELANAEEPPQAEDMTKPATRQYLKSLEKARDILLDFESRFPDADEPAGRRAHAALAERGNKLVDAANRLAETNQTLARDLLRAAENVNPARGGLNALKKQLKGGYNTLVVGVRRTPVRMTPATARSDAEKMAVELLFEGLLEPMPDAGVGTDYRAVLAAGKPTVSATGRELSLVGSADWGAAKNGRFDAADLTETLHLLADKRHLPSAEGVDWFDEPTLDPADPNGVRVRLRAGHPDPRELLTLKLLPGKWLKAQNKTADDDDFARQPFGTGPYRLAPEYKPPVSNETLPGVSFVANPNYWRRPTSDGPQSIQEVRFVNLAAVPDPVGEVRGDRLHLIPDLPTADIAAFSKQDRASVVTPTANRRVHVLAVNHLAPALQELSVRRGISLAVDREAILDEVYRAGHKEFHRPLTGPFPPQSWLTPDKPPPLYDVDLAGPKLREVNGASGELTLLYPNDDPQAKAACELIAKQVAAAAGPQWPLSVKPTPSISPADFRARVEDQHRYDLAYLTIDYPNDWYSLGLATLLDPTAAGKGGRNVFGYLIPGTRPTKEDERLSRMLADLRQSRDADGKIKGLSQDVFTQFNAAVPFVPLWQLDRHLLVANSLKVCFGDSPDPVPLTLLDSTRLFQQTERWRMEDAK